MVSFTRRPGQKNRRIFCINVAIVLDYMQFCCMIVSYRWSAIKKGWIQITAVFLTILVFSAHISWAFHHHEEEYARYSQGEKSGTYVTVYALKCTVCGFVAHQQVPLICSLSNPDQGLFLQPYSLFTAKFISFLYTRPALSWTNKGPPESDQV